MSSSFKDRLERLHGSRKRAQERQQEDDQHGVFSAEDAREMQTPPGQPPPEEPDSADPTPQPSEDDASDTSQPPEKPETLDDMTVRRADREPSSSEQPDEPNEDRDDRDRTDGDHRKTEVGQRLARRYSLRDRSEPTGSDRGKDKRETEGVAGSRGDVSRETTGNPRPNEHAETLRREAEDHLADDDWRAALPLLYEITALLPRHAFALEKLADYHRRQGNDRLADHFESRLRDVVPF